MRGTHRTNSRDSFDSRDRLGTTIRSLHGVDVSRCVIGELSPPAHTHRCAGRQDQQKPGDISMETHRAKTRAWRLRCVSTRRSDVSLSASSSDASLSRSDGRLAAHSPRHEKAVKRGPWIWFPQIPVISILFVDPATTGGAGKKLADQNLGRGCPNVDFGLRG